MKIDEQINKLMKTLFFILIFILAAYSAFSQKVPVEPFETTGVYLHIIDIFKLELLDIDSMNVTKLYLRENQMIRSSQRGKIFSEDLPGNIYYAKDFLKILSDSSIYLNALYNEKENYLEKFSCDDEAYYRYLVTFKRNEGTEVKILLDPESGKFSLYFKSPREEFELFHSCINDFGWRKLTGILKI